MSKGRKKVITTSVWFDRWVKEAESRAQRRRAVEEAIRVLTGALIVAGALIMLVGVMWIDSTDICRGNVIMSFTGLGLSLLGAWIRWASMEGYIW